MRPLFLAFFALLGMACHSTPPTAHEPLGPADYPWEILGLGRFPDGTFWQQKVQARFQGRAIEFEAILQKQGAELLLLGLTPVGTQAFVLRQRGRDLQFESSADVNLPIPPRFILIDIQRVFFPMGDPIEAGWSGVRTIQLEAELVEESWIEGSLVSRRFSRPGGPSNLPIEIRYLERSSKGCPASVIVLHNQWFDYELEIRTIVAGA